MQIPEALQHFPEPALIVTADHVHARFWLAFEDSMEPLDEMEMPKELKSDKDTSFVNVDTHGVHAPEPRYDEERLRHFLRAIAMRVNELIRDEEAATSVHLLLPDDMLAPLKKELAPEAANILGKEIRANVMKEDEVQILERIVGA